MTKDISCHTMYFAKPGPHNTESCLEIGAKRAQTLDISKIILATCSGQTALTSLDFFDQNRFQLIAVTHVTGFSKPNTQELDAETRNKLIKKGFQVFTGAHAFGGVGRGVRNKLKTFQLEEIMAYTLRMFGQGVKVGVEMGLMCADAGLARTDEEVLTIAGTAKGADTAMVITPANSHNCLDLKIHEIIAKPRNP